MNKVHHKITALLTASLMTVMSMGVVSAQTDNNAQIKSIDAENGTVTVDVIKSGSYKIYAAIYKDKLLQGLYTVDSITSSGVFNFGKEIEFDEDTETLKCFIWDGSMKPVGEIYKCGVSEPTENPSTTKAPSVTKMPAVTDEPTTTKMPTVTDEPTTTKTPAVTDEPTTTDTPTETDKPTATETPSETGQPTTTDTPTTTDNPITYGAVITLSDDGIAIDGTGATAEGSVVTISQAGEYTVTGSLSDGQIAVALPTKSDEVTINLEGVDVTSTTGAPFAATKGKVDLSAKKGTTNSFTSTATYNEETVNACVYSKNDLTIKGKGTLKVSSTYNNAIGCKADVTIKNLTLNVTEAANNGIKGNDSVTVESGNVTVNSNGDAIKSDEDPAYDGDVLEGGTVKIADGTVTLTTGTTTKDGTTSTSDGIKASMLCDISGGTINITSTGDAIKANASSIDEDNPTIADGDGSINITGGTINISAGEDGIKGVKSVNVSDGEITITKAEDGIQVSEVVYDTDGTTVKAYVTGSIGISGGTFNITSSEDGIQCGTGNITITGGDVTVNSTMDCIQAENILNISDGTFNLKSYGGAPATVSSNNSSTTDSCKGVKAGSLVNISGGTFNINTYDDGIHSNNTVRISGGDIDIAAGDDGVHGDSYLYITDNADINITKSYEGIEAAKIYVQGGKTYIVSTDDGANAAGDEPTENAITLSSDDIAEFAGPGGFGGGNQGPNWGGEDSSSYGYLEVSGGLLYIEAEGDGFDSNGDGVITGGIVLVNGPTSGGNGVFDVGDNNNTLTITGGIVIGAGTSDMAVTPTKATNSQYYVVASGSSSSGGGGGFGGHSSSSSSSGFSTQATGKAFKLTDSSGNEIVTYVPSKQYSWVLVSTPEMSSGTYTLNYGGSVTGGTFTNGNYGLVTDGAYSGSSTISLSAKQ